MNLFCFLRWNKSKQEKEAHSIVFKPQLLQSTKYFQWREQFEKLNLSRRGTLQYCSPDAMWKASREKAIASLAWNVLTGNREQEPQI